MRGTGGQQVGVLRGAQGGGSGARWAHTRLRVVDGSTRRTPRANVARVVPPWFTMSATLSWTLSSCKPEIYSKIMHIWTRPNPRGSSYKRREEHVWGNFEVVKHLCQVSNQVSARRFGGQPASCRPSRRGPPKVLPGVALRYSTPMFGAGSLEPAAPAMPCSASACGTHSTASRRAASEAPGPLSPSSRRRTAPRLWAQNVTALTSLLVLLSTPLSAAEVASTPAEGGRRLRYAPSACPRPSKAANVGLSLLLASQSEAQKTSVYAPMPPPCMQALSLVC